MKCLRKKIVLFILIMSALCQGIHTMEFKTPYNEELPIENLPAYLEDVLTEFWCKGMNYTAICTGFPNINTCFGEVILAEVATERKIYDLHRYSSTSIGNKLSMINCNTQEDDENAATDYKHVVRQLSWIIPLVSLIIVGILGALGFAYQYNKRGSLDTSGNTEIPDDPESLTKTNERFGFHVV